MMGRYDNWVNCKDDLLASGYMMTQSREVLYGKLYSDTFAKGKHLNIIMNYGPGWCDMVCQINYSGKQESDCWRDLAGTMPNAYEVTKSEIPLVDRDKFMEVVCRYEYEQLEAEFRKLEIESTLEALP